MMTILSYLLFWIIVSDLKNISGNAKPNNGFLMALRQENQFQYLKFEIIGYDSTQSIEICKESW